MKAQMQNTYADVIVDESLINTKASGIITGYQFAIRLVCDRGQFLSVIESLEVTVDGFQVMPSNIKFCINGKKFSPAELEWCYFEFWNVIDPALIQVFCPGGLPNGPHLIDIVLLLRHPDVLVGEKDKPLIFNNSQKKLLYLKDGGEKRDGN